MVRHDLRIYRRVDRLSILAWTARQTNMNRRS
jgi:hypothetical protein